MIIFVFHVIFVQLVVSIPVTLPVVVVSGYLMLKTTCFMTIMYPVVLQFVLNVRFPSLLAPLCAVDAQNIFAEYIFCLRQCRNSYFFRIPSGIV